MKRILAACALLMAGLLAGAWASAQMINGLGGVYVNGQLQGAGSGSGTVTSVGLTLPPFMNVSGTPITTSGTFLAGLANVSAGAVFAGPASGADAEPDFRALLGTDLPIGLAFTDPTTDAAPSSTLLKSANAFPGAATNTTGANTILSGGIGQRIFTLIDFGHVSLDESTVTITVNGVATVKTEDADWFSVTSNDSAATSLAVAINAIAGVSATASAAAVRIVPDVGTYSLTIAKSAADAGMTATSGTDGVVKAGNTSGMADITGLRFADQGNGIWYIYGNSLPGTYPGPFLTFNQGLVNSYGPLLNIFTSNYGYMSIGGASGITGANGGVYFSDNNWGIGWGSGPFITKNASSDVEITTGKLTVPALKLFDQGTHYTTLQAQTQAADITLTLPPVANISGALRNDGTGSLTWDHNQLVDQFTYTFFDLATDLPATLDVPSIYVNRARAIHITEVYCEADTADGAVINLTNAGDTVLSGDLTCTTAGAASTSFVSGKDAVALNAKLSHVMVSVLAGLKRLNVVVKYTVD